MREEELRAYRNKAIEKDRRSIENRLNHAFNQGYEWGRQMAKPSWIACSDRLPEVGSEVLVCYEFKGKRNVYIADFYGDGKFHGLDDEYLTTEGRKYRKAVAWMPMPTPPNMSEIPTGAEGSDKE
jgi:hypothetical protein